MVSHPRVIKSASGRQKKSAYTRGPELCFGMTEFESEHVASRSLCHRPSSLVASVSPRFRRRNARARCSQRQPWRTTATTPQLLGKLTILNFTLNLAKPGRRYVPLIQPDLQALILNPPLLCHEQALIRLARLSFGIVQL